MAGVTHGGRREASEGYDPIDSTIMRLGDDAAAAAWCEQRHGSDRSSCARLVADAEVGP